FRTENEGGFPWFRHRPASRPSNRLSIVVFWTGFVCVASEGSGCCFSFPLPAPPSKQATAREDQAGKACAGDGAGHRRYSGCRAKIDGGGVIRTKEVCRRKTSIAVVSASGHTELQQSITSNEAQRDSHIKAVR